MSLESLRDLIIVIVGIEIILISIGVAVFGFIIYRKIKRAIDSVKKATRPLMQMADFIRSMRNIFRSQA